MRKQLSLLILSIILSFTQVAKGQGVFSSLATGNWNASGSWTLVSGTDDDGIPDADDNVTITTHSITVPAGTTVECNNLTVNNTTQRVLLAGANSILNIYGTLNAAATPTIETIIDCTSDATAKVAFKRATNGALFGATWAAIGTGLRFEVNLPIGITGTASTAVKAREITITSGTFDLGTFELRPDNTSTATGILTIQDGATLKCARVSKNGTAGTAFASFTINGTGKAVFTSATAFPNATTTLTFSSTSTIEYTGATYAMVDISYTGNIICSGTGSKTWTLGVSPRTIGGNVNITGTTALSMGGGNVVISGNVTVDDGAIIGCSSNAGTFTAASAGTQSFTLNGTARVTSNSSQAPNPTAGFNRQYAFDAYTIGNNSVISFRNPTASSSVSLNIDQPTGVSFANVEFYDIQTAAYTTTFLLKQNILVTGSVAFPRIASGQAIVFDMNGFSLKVGKQILNTLGTLGTNVGNTNSATGTRTYTMSGLLELNGSSAQSTLGGTDLPATFSNLKLNNSAGVTIANAVTVSGTLSLAGNNTYTTLSNITGYTGLEYAATVAQTTGSEFGSSIANLTINNSNGVTLNADRSVTGTLALTTGTLATSTNSLTIGATGTVSGASATSYVNGNLIKLIAANTTTKSFEIGDATTYAPVTLDFDGTISNSTGSIQASTTAADHAQIAGSNLNASKSANRTWTLTNATALTGLNSYSPTFNFVSGDVDVDANTSNFIIGNYSNSAWGYPTVGTKTTTSTQATGVTTFGDFAVGEDKGGATATNSVKQSNQIKHTAYGIEVSLNGNSSIELYTMNGLLIDKTTASGSYSHNLNNGIYIIRINGKAIKFVK